MQDDDPFAPLAGFAYDLDGKPRYATTRGEIHRGAAPQSSTIKAADQVERMMEAKGMMASQPHNLHVSRTDAVPLATFRHRCSECHGSPHFRFLSGIGCTHGIEEEVMTERREEGRSTSRRW